jgi:hypothetical protein
VSGVREALARPGRTCSTGFMELTALERMNLMRFVCSFAWTDLRVSQAERDLVMRICGRLDLTDEETRTVRGWLEVPPRAEDVDPNAVPHAHRELFLRMAEMVVAVDGEVVAAERESLQLFRALLA